MRPRQLIVFTIVLAGLLGLLLLDIGRLVLAPSLQASIDAVRVRNALVSELGTAEQTDWTPSAVPANFTWEREEPSQFIAEIVGEILPPGTEGLSALDKADRIAHHISANASVGAPIQSGIRETYEKIVSGNGGYCSDFTQTFNALALAAGIGVREWGFAWETMANGHAFNEIWEPELRKWVFIDSHSSFYALDKVSRVPLSVVELQDALMSGNREGVELVPIVPEKFAFSSPDMALAWYRRGLPRMYLLLGNNAFSYDSHPLIKFAEDLPRSVEMMLAIMLGEHPRFLFVPAETQPEVRAQVESMIWERVLLMAKFAGMAVLGIALLMTFRRLMRSRSRLAPS